MRNKVEETVIQIKGARAMLGMKQGELAKQAGCCVSTLNNIERGVQKDLKQSTLRNIITALECAGAIFTQESAYGCFGVAVQPKCDPVNVTLLDSK